MNLFWAGDQTTTWDEYDGFKSSIVGILNRLSGMAINHSDIGGDTNFHRLIYSVLLQGHGSLMPFHQYCEHTRV